MRGTNKDPIDRAFRLVNMINRGPLTNRDIRNEFGISKDAARNLITRLSLHFPIYEVGTRAENSTGPESIVYGLLK